MDGIVPPLLSPSIPRFAPPRTHTRTPSRSPTRPRLADDILSDLSPATTLEAFTNPSGKLKASIEAATPSERAFGLRATLASKKIQEWVDELSGWPWPAERGSVGFEIPSAKRRKLSIQGDDRGRRSSNGYAQEPEYIGSVLETEVERYENRIDDITADMEDLNVEEIKRQVLDTHFSPRSRPSSSASNAPPMPSLFASYTRMDDFAAVITATVLQSLPNLSRLTRLMDVWNIRLSVLRKVPPLMLALEDAEIAMKSGWTTIEKSDTSPNPTSQTEDLYLTRQAFEIMRSVLQDKVTTLGQVLDYMLDTLEGREDTLPDAWLVRMEIIENDYGSWVVAGDRKVREGEWARMAKARKEEDDARKLKAAEAAETARRKAEEEARLKAIRDAEQAEAASLKAELEAQETARLLALKEAEKDEAARLVAEQLELRRLKEEAQDPARQQALREAEEAETARLIAEQQADSARLQAEEESRDIARQRASQEAKMEAARFLSEQQAESTRLHAEEEARKLDKRKALEVGDVAKIETARLLFEQHEAEENARKAQQQALKDAEIAEAVMVKAELEAQEIAEKQAIKETQRVEAARLVAEQQAKEEASQQAAAELAILKAKCDADEAAFRQAQLYAENAESQRRLEEAELARQKSEEEAEFARQQALDAETPALKAKKYAETADSAWDLESGRITNSDQQAKKDAETTRVEAQEINVAESARPRLMSLELDESVDQRISDCDICEEIRTSKPNSPSQPVMGNSASSGESRVLKFVDSLTPDFEDAVNPQLSRYAPFDGGNESSEPAIRITEVGFTCTSGLDLASPIHLDDSFPQTPTSSNVASAARVFTSPASEKSSPPRSKGLPFGQGFASIVRVSSPPAREDRTPQLMPDNIDPSTARASPQTPVRPVFSFDGANDVEDSVQSKSADGWIVVDSRNNAVELPTDNQDRHSDPERSKSRPSIAFDYSTSEPSPETFEVQPAEYCFTPTRTPQPLSDQGDLVIPTIPFPAAPKADAASELQDLTPTKSPRPFASIRNSRESTNSILSPVAEELLSRSTELDVDGPCDPCETAVRELESDEKEYEETALPVLTSEVTSETAIDSLRRISATRRESISSDASTIIHGRVSESPSSTVASPISEDATESSIEQSPSAGRIGHRNTKSYDISPPNSPPPGVAQRPTLFLPSTPGYSPSTAPSTPLPDSMPSTPLDAPVFGNVNVSTMPIISSPSKSNTDVQMQQQISSLLESIPARIRLTTEPNETPVASQTLRPKKIRRSITPSFRSSSSMSNYSTSSRAPTPSFTLAPAFGKTSSRPRPQSSNPEIKLYHLSRSTGEAPIKLFVRLVGEHGERVMVRVGGGWADLGEYLKEYASHHGRRSALDSNDKIQIQDLPSRNVSSSSTATLRGNGGRSTPDPRPQSVMERERPASSLYIRKTRRSIGDSSSSSSSASNTITNTDSFRAPSTPLPSSRTLAATTPSTTSSTSTSADRERPNRSSSRLSWTSDDVSQALGLAGPKSKNITISERDHEWVESMKEKVRLASAEKERRERDSGVGLGGGGGGGYKGKERGEGTAYGGTGRESRAGMGNGRESRASGGRDGSGSESRASFGEMEKVGGTKRLFRKGL